MRERDRLLKHSPSGFDGTAVEEAMTRGKQEELNREEKDDGWEDLEEKADGGKKKEQKVYVLDRGFVGWQEKYGEDERLTEGYRKELWKDGYWM
jgi:hypothetical protein